MITPVSDGIGWIEVVCGCMFSGKSEELIRRLRRAQIAGQDVCIFKPTTDDRHEKEYIVSHNQQRIECTPVSEARHIIELVHSAHVVGIDEVQFFSEQIVDVSAELAQSGKRVIVAGLDTDFRGFPFDPMPQLMAIAEDVCKVHAVCMKCGSTMAVRSHRLTTVSEQVVVGGKEYYEALCRKCFVPPTFH